VTNYISFILSLIFFKIIVLYNFSANSLEINDVKLCTNLDYRNYDCQKDIKNDENINIREIKRIHVVTKIKNIQNENQELQIEFLFFPDKIFNTYQIKNTIYKNKKMIEAPKSIKVTNCKNCFSSKINLLIKNSLNFKTHAFKTIDKNVHIGAMKISFFTKNQIELYSKTIYLNQNL